MILFVYYSSVGDLHRCATWR